MAGVCGGKIVVFGGYNGLNNLNVTEIYDPVSDSWIAGPTMPVAVSEMAQGITYTGNRIYSIGSGIFGASLRPVQALICPCDDDDFLGVYHDNGAAYTGIDGDTGADQPIQVGGFDLFANLNGVTALAYDAANHAAYVSTGDSDDALYRTDLTTGVTTLVGFFTNGATNIQAMDLAPDEAAAHGFTPGLLYGISIDGVGACNPNCFFSIDPATAVSTPISRLQLNQGRGISFNPVTGELWVFDQGGKNVYTIAGDGTLTYQFTVPSSNLQECTGIDTAFSLAHDCQGRLFTVDIAYGVLVEIDVEARQAYCVGSPRDIIGPGGSQDIQGLDGGFQLP